jgi:hypothetical protein
MTPSDESSYFWIRTITDGQFNDDKPQFSPDGNTIYFTSTRDGYLCIWAQRLDPMTKQPVGAAYPYQHFHNSMGHSVATIPDLLMESDLSVARDKIMICLPQMSSSLWLLQVE